MGTVDDRPSYEDWMQKTRKADEAARRTFGSMGSEGPDRAPTGHPLKELYPPTGDPQYDERGARRQVHSRAARDVAGFDGRQLERIRQALEAGETPELPDGWSFTRNDPVPGSPPEHV